MHSPGLTGGGQATGVLVVPFHPFVACRLWPALSEEEEIKVMFIGGGGVRESAAGMGEREDERCW